MNFIRCRIIEIIKNNENLIYIRTINQNGISYDPVLYLNTSLTFIYPIIGDEVLLYLKDKIDTNFSFAIPYPKKDNVGMLMNEAFIGILNNNMQFKNGEQQLFNCLITIINSLTSYLINTQSFTLNSSVNTNINTASFILNSPLIDMSASASVNFQAGGTNLLNMNAVIKDKDGNLCTIESAGQEKVKG